MQMFLNYLTLQTREIFISEKILTTSGKKILPNYIYTNGDTLLHVISAV
jgi:hypothetical protein